MARSISLPSRGSTECTSTPNDAAAVWMAASAPTPENCTGSRITATRDTLGEISLSNSSHFPLIMNSNWTNPVVLPPGRAMLAIRPRLTGSVVSTNTIGIVRVACCNAPTVVPPTASITSGSSATNSVAIFAIKLCVASAPAILDLQVTTECPASLLKRTDKGRRLGGCLRIIGGQVH